MTFTSRMSRRETSPSQSSEGEMTLDTSLTSLSWLLNLRVLDLVTPDVSETILFSSIGEDGCKLSPVKEVSSAVGVSLSPIKKCLIQCAEFSSAPRKYRTDSSKPPFTHTTLIYLAMKHSRAGRVSLDDVLKWIRVNFKFYRTADSLWEVSYVCGVETWSADTCSCVYACVVDSSEVNKLGCTPLTVIITCMNVLITEAIGCCRIPFGTTSRITTCLPKCLRLMAEGGVGGSTQSTRSPCTRPAQQEVAREL